MGDRLLVANVVIWAAIIVTGSSAFGLDALTCNVLRLIGIVYCVGTLMIVYAEQRRG